MRDKTNKTFLFNHKMFDLKSNNFSETFMISMKISYNEMKERR